MQMAAGQGNDRASPAPATVGFGRYYNVQVLRFLAAFAVVVGHAFIFTSQKIPISADIVELGGWAGGWSVTLFFCISGFVITHGAQQLSAGQFLAHRLARIYPAYWLAVLFVCAAKLALLGGVPVAELSLLSATLLPAGERPYPLWIEWSLIYEVFFYTMFALLWIRRSNRIVIAGMSIWLLLILAAALKYPDWASARYPTPAQLVFSGRNVPFVLGVFCYYLRGSLTPALRTILLTLFPAGLAGIVAFSSTDMKILASSLAAFGLLSCVVSKPSKVERDAVPVKLGDFSYGIYLVHIATITILLSIGFKQYQNPWLIVIAVTAMGTTAGAIYGFIELTMYRQIRRLIDHRFARRAVLRSAVTASQPG
jgi:exopolysaccharide production protein ExoZ